MTLTQNVQTEGLQATLKWTSYHSRVHDVIEVNKVQNVIEVTGPAEEKLKISFQRTIRVPDYDGDSELPPGAGAFPLYDVADYKVKLANAMSIKEGLFFPMYQREAMWINFESRDRFAVQVHVGRVNAISGGSMVKDEATMLCHLSLIEEKESIQNYVVTPD